MCLCGQVTRTLQSTSDASTLAFGCQVRTDEELISRLQVGAILFYSGVVAVRMWAVFPLLIFILSGALVFYKLCIVVWCGGSVPCCAVVSEWFSSPVYFACLSVESCGMVGGCCVVRYDGPLVVGFYCWVGPRCILVPGIVLTGTWAVPGHWCHRCTLL